MSKMKRFRKSPNPSSDHDSGADEFDFTWSNFLNHHAYFPKEFGEDYTM